MSDYPELNETQLEFYDLAIRLVRRDGKIRGMMNAIAYVLEIDNLFLLATALNIKSPLKSLHVSVPGPDWAPASRVPIWSDHEEEETPGPQIGDDALRHYSEVFRRRLVLDELSNI